MRPNDSRAFRRNRVRHELIKLLDDVAGRDVVPILARQAALLHDERTWLDDLALDDRAVSLETRTVGCCEPGRGLACGAGFGRNYAEPTGVTEATRRVPTKWNARSTSSMVASSRRS